MKNCIDKFLVTAIEKQLLQHHNIEIKLNNFIYDEDFLTNSYYFYDILFEGITLYNYASCKIGTLNIDFIIDNIVDNIDSFLDLKTNNWSKRHLIWLRLSLVRKFRTEGLKPELKEAWKTLEDEGFNEIIHSFTTIDMKYNLSNCNFINIYQGLLENLNQDKLLDILISLNNDPDYFF